MFQNENIINEEPSTLYVYRDCALAMLKAGKEKECVIIVDHVTKGYFEEIKKTGMFHVLVMITKGLMRILDQHRVQLLTHCTVAQSLISNNPCVTADGFL